MKKNISILAFTFFLFSHFVSFTLFAQEEFIEIKESECSLAEIDVQVEMCVFETNVTAIEAPKEENPIYSIVEEPAEFEGGYELFSEIVKNNLNITQTMKEGRVFIEFVVDTTGKMTNLKVIKGLTEENDKETLRLLHLINEYYTWQPAKQRGKKVRVRMILPILFKQQPKPTLQKKRVYER